MYIGEGTSATRIRSLGGKGLALRVGVRRNNASYYCTYHAHTFQFYSLYLLTLLTGNGQPPSQAAAAEENLPEAGGSGAEPGVQAGNEGAVLVGRHRVHLPCRQGIGYHDCNDVISLFILSFVVFVFYFPRCFHSISSWPSSQL